MNVILFISLGIPCHISQHLKHMFKNNFKPHKFPVGSFRNEWRHRTVRSVHTFVQSNFPLFFFLFGKWRLLLVDKGSKRAEHRLLLFFILRKEFRIYSKYFCGWIVWQVEFLSLWLLLVGWIVIRIQRDFNLRARRCNENVMGWGFWFLFGTAVLKRLDNGYGGLIFLMIDIWCLLCNCPLYRFQFDWITFHNKLYKISMSF